MQCVPFHCKWFAHSRIGHACGTQVTPCSDWLQAFLSKEREGLQAEVESLQQSNASLVEEVNSLKQTLVINNSNMSEVGFSNLSEVGFGNMFQIGFSNPSEVGLL